MIPNSHDSITSINLYAYGMEAQVQMVSLMSMEFTDSIDSGGGGGKDLFQVPVPEFELCMVGMFSSHAEYDVGNH